MNIKLDSDTLSAMRVFSEITNVTPRDCMVNDDKLIFVVNQGQAGLAIGKNGVKMKVLHDMLKKDIMVIEYADDPIKLLENIIRPNKLLSGYLTNGQGDDKKINVDIEGKVSSYKIKLIKLLMQRYFNILSINIK